MLRQITASDNSEEDKHDKSVDLLVEQLSSILI